MKKHERKIQIAMIICGVIFMVIGICRGEVTTIWQKAVYICLECIGIG